MQKLSHEEIENLVGSCIRLLLFQDMKKLPVRRKDFTDKVFEQYKGNNITSELLAIVKERVPLLGYDLIEISRNNRPSGIYLLKNRLNKDHLNQLNMKFREERLSSYTLLMVVLSLIFINKGKLEEDRLFTQLKTLNVESTYKNYQSVIKVQLVRQLYLKRKKLVGRGEKSKWIYSMGERSMIEIGKRIVVEHIAEVLLNL
eukprot:TRINITY_DN518_c0_g1_i2.p1 TRINITY_DN518_c0_g1~~TRINITY_DN518_c0_g1_i2.p1  ORF type:complete len:201 (-),score=27.51 TRINITY_DN518_c0_g1_i2:188-790(-)